MFLAALVFGSGNGSGSFGVLEMELFFYKVFGRASVRAAGEV